MKPHRIRSLIWCAGLTGFVLLAAFWKQIPQPYRYWILGGFVAIVLSAASYNMLKPLKPDDPLYRLARDDKRDLVRFLRRVKGHEKKKKQKQKTSGQHGAV